MSTDLQDSVVEAETRTFMIPGPTRDPVDLPVGFAPMIRNAWYVMAESKNVARELGGVMVCGEPLVYYRTQNGEPVVLDDRCAHRRFSLAKSRLVGDTVVCGYHGFTYEKTGKCVWAPGLATEPNFGIRRYPCAEVGPWLWVWMGNPERADVAEIPYPKLDEGENWRKVEGYKFNPGNYLLLIENFFDQAHLHFLHGDHVSDLAQATTLPKTLETPPNVIAWRKDTDQVKAGLFAGLAGGDPDELVRVVGMDTQYGPSLNYGVEDRYSLEGVENPLYPLRFHVFNAITPKDINGTHQFFQLNTNFDVLQGLDWFRDFSRDVVFQQDVEAIESMQNAIVNDHRTGKVEFGIASDRFGLTMRRMLKKMKDAELVDA